MLKKLKHSKLNFMQNKNVKLKFIICNKIAKDLNKAE